MRYVYLGNRDALHRANGHDAPFHHEPDKRATLVEFPDSWTYLECLYGLTQKDGILFNNFGSAPAWIACTDPELAQFIATGLGISEVREVQGPHAVKKPAKKAAKKIAKKATASLQLQLLLTMLVLWETSPHLKTNYGNDFQAQQMASSSASATNVAKWMGITNDNTAPAGTDTTLTGEVTTAGGGLVRKEAAYAHTLGTNTYTLTCTYTANGSDTGLPFTARKMGVFDALSSGGMVFETLISPTFTVSSPGDVGTVTQTVTL